jgi:uncharacterized protein YjiS (DUF1127 family)
MGAAWCASLKPEVIMRSAITCPQERMSLNAGPSPWLAGRSGQAIRRWWRAYWDWRAREATVLILKSLDRRTLHDIGITQSEIESCVHASRSDLRRLYDVNWLWRPAR